MKINKNIDTMSNIMYNSMKRDINQSGLEFWKKEILPNIEKTQLNKDVFEKVAEKAEKDNNINIFNIVKQWINNYKKRG